MELDQFLDVDVRDPVSIGKAEPIAINVLANTQQPPARVRLSTGIYQRDLPRLRMRVVNLNLIATHVERRVRLMQEIVRKILFDQIPLVSAADHEVPHAVRGEDLHDVP